MKNPNSPSLLRSKPAPRILAASAAALLASLAGARGQAISISGVSTYTQNFDTLPTTAGTNWADGTAGTLPGWYARTDTLGPASPAATALPIAIYDGGAASARGFFSIGPAASTERALGASPTTTGYGIVLFGAEFRNTSASPLAVGEINYNGELWVTHGTANIQDGFQFFYQIAAAPITDLGPFTVANAATYDANAAVADTGWTRFTGLDYADFNTAAASLLAAPVVKNVKLSLGVTLQPNEYLMLRWRNANDTGTDAIMGIDDLRVSFTTAITYNLTHTAGGSPNGVLEVSANQYWLNGATGVGFASGDGIIFSQNPATTATISVPADVTTGAMTVSAASGTYSIGGIGKISGPLAKSGAGTLVLTSANSFTSTAISGGIVELQNAAALGTGPVTFATAASTLRIRDNGAGNNGTLAYGNNVNVAINTTLDLDRATGGTSTGNTVALGNLAIGAQVLTVTGTNGYKARFTGTTTLSGAATISTNSEVILQGAISGAATSTLTKSGTGRLIINSNSNTYTGLTTVNTGGSIGGNGTVGAALTVDSGATLAPGASIGVFSTNTNATLSPGSTFSLDIAHTSVGAVVAGTDYDQLKVGTGVGAVTTGLVTLTGSNLALTIGTGVVAGDVFIIILNDLAEPVTGIFTGLAQNATVSAGAQQFRISYTANSATNAETGGNDVSLVALAIPEPGTALLGLLGAATLLRGRRSRLG